MKPDSKFIRELPKTQPSSMEEEEAKEPSPGPPQPADWLTRVVVLQLADFIHNCMALLFSPISSLLYLASDSYRKAEEAKDSLESTAQKVPSNITHGTALLIKKMTLGLLGAAYACLVLMMVAAVAVALGFGLVQFWLEEPVSVRESLHFDYTDIHPKAVVSVCSGLGRGGGGLIRIHGKTAAGGVPVGHTLHATVVLLMPESGYNRYVGVFQLTAELLAENGQVIAKSSQPCMLRFQSFPIRLLRVLLFSVPLLLGISTETQKLHIYMLKHKEAAAQRSYSIRITITPRAGTLSPPQLYEAEILMYSQLPFSKDLVHRWKWTFCVWVSMYTYMVLLVIMLCCCKPLILCGPFWMFGGRLTEEEHVTDYEAAREGVPVQPWADADHQEREISELLRRLQRRRSKRKAAVLADDEATAGSSMSVMTSTTVEQEDVGDSESVC